MSKIMTSNSSEQQDRDEKSRTRRAYGWYQRYSRANWLRRAWLFFWDFKTKGDVVAAIASLGIIGTAAGMSVKDAVDYQRLVARDQVQVESRRWSDHSSVYTVVGRDNAGRKAWFDILVLDKNYSWVRGSWSELERDGKPLRMRDIPKTVFTPEIRNGLARSGEFITVGVASSEGDPEEEKLRALRRARTSAIWLASAMGDGVPIRLLNLGQHRGHCKRCETKNTSWQRPFMIIGVRNKQPGVVLKEALRDAFSGKSNLPSPANYSSFVLTKSRS